MQVGDVITKTPLDGYANVAVVSRISKHGMVYAHKLFLSRDRMLSASPDDWINETGGWTVIGHVEFESKPAEIPTLQPITTRPVGLTAPEFTGATEA